MKNLLPTQQQNGVVAVEQAKAIAEVQAAMVIANANPRNEIAATEQIKTICQDKQFAETAIWAYRRGGDLLEGPSIYLMEAIARAWGHIHYGFRELNRSGDISEVEAYAHDLQTNTKVTRQFYVRHFRDTKQGLKKLTSERDRYEIVANMAQRRVRALLEELIPAHIVNMAVNLCKKTQANSVGNIKQAIKKILEAFQELNITKDDIENYLQRELKSITPADIIKLRRIYKSLQDGVAKKEDFFQASNSQANPETVDIDPETGEVKTDQKQTKPAEPEPEKEPSKAEKKKGAKKTKAEKKAIKTEQPEF